MMWGSRPHCARAVPPGSLRLVGPQRRGPYDPQGRSAWTWRSAYNTARELLFRSTQGTQAACLPMSMPHRSRPHPVTGLRSERLGVMPDPAHLPSLPSFTPGEGSTATPLDLLADAALGSATPDFTTGADGGLGKSLHTTGPYNPAATLPPKIVRKIIALEFVEMAELRADIWPDESVTPETTHPPHRLGKPPVTNIRSWLEGYGRMAAILATRFPEKAAELWAYQTTILHAAHAYEG